MNVKLVVLMIPLGMSLPGAPAVSKQQAGGEPAELRREISELKAILIKLNEQLEALEQRLARVEARPWVGNPSLRFPLDVERAMMIPHRRDVARDWEGPFVEPLIPDTQRERIPNPLPQSIPGPLDEPRLRP
jgi:hypothetical protein